MPLPDPPPDLPRDQQPIWADTVARLTDLGTTQVDPRHLRAYVQAAHQHDYFTRLLDQTAPMIDQDGRPVVNPALTHQRTAARDIARLARTLGLTRTGTPAGPVAGRKPMAGPDDHWGARWCEEHQRWECSGQKSRGRGQCHQIASLGLSTCKNHPGRNGKVKHLVAVATRDGEKIGGRLPGGGLVPEFVHPRAAMLYQVRYWTGMCQWLDDIVSGLAQGELVWGMIRRVDMQGGEFPGVTVIEQAGRNTWVDWQMQAHRQLTSVCEKALSADVAADLVKLQREQGLAAFRAFQAGLGRLGLDAEQWGRAREVMPQVLRELNAA